MAFRTGDAESLVGCMEAIIADPLIADTIGQKAFRRIAQLFAADLMVREHMQTYREISNH
jgi:hypothetical protein